MKRLIGVLVGLAVVLSATQAEAVFKQREREVVFLRWNRGTAVNVAARVSSTVAKTTLASSKTDTSAVLDMLDLIPAPVSATVDAADTLRALARLFITSDSTAAGDMTALTVECHCVTGDHKALSIEQPHSVAVFSRAYTTMGSKRAYAIPIAQETSPPAVSYIGDPSFTGSGLVLCPRWRFVFKSITGTLGTVRATLVYYHDIR